MTPAVRDIIILASGIDASALAWKAAVVANGGTVSPSRLAIVSQFIRAEKASGAWALTDDYWGLWGENAPQALTSLKQRRLAVAVNSPTFTADRGYVFDGATNYIDTGFAPVTHGVALTGTSMQLSAYERTNVAGTTYAAGSQNNTSTRNLRIAPRVVANTAIGNANSGALTSSAITDSRGLTGVFVDAGTTYGFYKNGVAAGTTVPGTSGALAPTANLLIGATSGPGSFRAASVGIVVVGGSLPAGQALAQYNAVQAWATAVGAQV